MNKAYEISDIKVLQEITKVLSKQIRGGEVFALTGELGSGKTTFCKYLLKSRGVTKTVTSPTFILMAPYSKGKTTFYHLDLYRIADYKEAQALGIEELWQKPENVFLIEWADKIKNHLPNSTIYLHFSIDQNGKRQLRVRNAPEYIKI
jgi:tRNA threonylcarbamoyladenosine biosynthesis protein TsaE